MANHKNTGMKTFGLLLFIFISFTVSAQKNWDSILLESRTFQKELNESYADSNHSPLTKSDFATFTGLPFFEIDSTFYVLARFEKAKKRKSIKLKTSTDRKPKYEVYGTLFFQIAGQDFSLKVYQSHSLREKEEFKDYLFLPFMDATNGTTTYAGGRYLDFSIPDSDRVYINFNKAYNPYCAYSARYSCPIVPEENFVDIEIKAGVMAHQNHAH